MTALQIVQLLIIALVPAVLLRRWTSRRAALRRVAAAHGLTFRGLLPSDTYTPYTRFEDVRRGVLLDNVMEGRWNGFDVAVFDLPRRTQKRIGAIVALPRDGTRFQVLRSPNQTWVGTVPAHSEEWTVVNEGLPDVGPETVVREAFTGSAAAGIGVRTAALLRTNGEISVETNVGYAFVLSTRQIAPDRVPDFIELVVSLARALDADAAMRAGQ